MVLLSTSVEWIWEESKSNAIERFEISVSMGLKFENWDT
jgi:hypothetical protein